MSEFHSSRGGSYSNGQMPTQMLIDKFESTKLYEQPRQLRAHFRSVLSDESPDAPYMEADMPRDNSTQSRLKIGLREGFGNGATDTEPYLEDGTFLDHEFLEADRTMGPDGHRLDDMRRQRAARTRFINFSNDSDNSVPESGINPLEMRKQIRNSFALTRARKKIFSKSEVNFQAKTFAARDDAPSRVTYDNSEINVDEFSPSRITGGGWTPSDITLAGHHVTPSGEFATAQYGGTTQKLAHLYLNSDYGKNRASAESDSARPALFQDQVVTRQLAKVMENIRRQYDAGQADTVFGSSAEQSPEAMVTKFMGGLVSQEGALQSRAMEIGRAMHDELLRRSNRQVDTNESRIPMSYVTKQIIEYAAANNRSATPHVPLVRIGNDIQSGARHMTNAESTNKKGTSQTDKTALFYDSLSYHPTIEFKTVVNYKAASPIQSMNFNEQYAWDQTVKQSFASSPYVLAKQYRVSQQAANHDSRIGHEREQFRSASGPGAKITRQYAQNGHDPLGVNDH